MKLENLDTYLLIAAGIALIAVQVAYDAGFSFSHRSFLVSIFTSILVLVISTTGQNKISAAFLDWAAVVGLIFIYGNLRDVSALYQGLNITPYLSRFEDVVLGISPTIYVSKFLDPIITDFFTVIYGLYLIVPLMLATYVYFRIGRKYFIPIKLSLIIVIFAGFILYILFPASPPRFYLEYPNEITGILFNTLQPSWDAGSFSAHRGAFPSLHVGISAVAAFESFKLRRIMNYGKVIFIACTSITLLISASTIYLRHHWILDIAAGLILAYAAHLITHKRRPT